MSAQDTPQRIVSHLRSTGEPAVSASTLAEKLDVSVRTINNHVDGLVEEEKIETTQIGNAAAYYIPYDDQPRHSRPEHTCKRCGRTAGPLDDIVRMDVNLYFENGGYEDGEADFYTLCRFCYSELVHWLYDGEPRKDYKQVHSWRIPENQLKEVQSDPDLQTAPSREYLDDAQVQIVEYIEEQEGDNGVSESELISKTEDWGMIESVAKQQLDRLRRRGYIYRTKNLLFKAAE